MIISRQQYEQDLEKAYQRGSTEAEEHFWRQERERRMYERMDGLEVMIRKHCEPTEGGSFENATCADERRPITRPF